MTANGTSYDRAPQVQAVAILCVEDDEPTRRRIASALRRRPGFSVAAAATLAEARRSVEEGLPSVLVTDLQLPDGHGLQLIRELRARSREVEVLVISVLDDEASVVAAIAAGASGYILKDALSEDIAGTVEAVLKGHSPLSPGIARFILRQLRHDGQPLPAGAPKLTKREIDILWGIAKGFTYNDIADSLGISRKTVPNYIKSIYRKLEVSNRSEAVFEALQRKLIEL